MLDCFICNSAFLRFHSQFALNAAVPSATCKCLFATSDLDTALAVLLLGQETEDYLWETKKNISSICSVNSTPRATKEVITDGVVHTGRCSSE